MSARRRTGPRLRARLPALLYALFLALALAGRLAAQETAGLDRAIDTLLAQARTKVAQPCPNTGERLVRVMCDNVLRVGVRGDYANFAAAKASRYSGYEIDLASRIAQRLGVAVQFVQVTPASRLPLLGEDKVDLVIATMGHTMDRDGQATFIRPHYYASQTVLIGPKGIQAADWRDLIGATVCATVGNSSNTVLVEHTIKLLLFDAPNRLLEQLQRSTCTFVAQDDSFFAAAFARPDFAARYDVKLAFGTLPWGLAVGRQSETRSLARLLSLLSAAYHRDGVFIGLAEANNVATRFLQQQQAVWRRPDCDRPQGVVAATCVLPPLDNRPARFSLAADTEQLEAWVRTATGFPLSLPMFKTVVAFDLFCNGLLYTVLLVFGGIVCTVAVAFGFGAVLWSGPRPAAAVVRWVALFFRSSPIVLLLFVGFTAATALVQFSLATALIVAIITLGLFNGSYGAQAVADARAALVRERGGVAPPFRLLASRVATPLTGFVINASKGSAVSSMIGTPELVSATTDISSFSSERLTLYVVLLLLYLAMVLLVILLCTLVRRALHRAEAVG